MPGNMEKTAGAKSEGLRSFIRRCVPRCVLQFLRKRYYPSRLRAFTEDQWPHSAAVKALVKPGDHVVDAGANIGYVTMLLSQWVGSQGQVDSFEPVPDTFELLSHNARALRLENVRLRHVALSDAAGEATMHVPEYSSGGENLYESSLEHGEGRAVRVRRSVLDRELPEAAKPAFMKIDVEGHELAMLRGATGVLDRAHPALLIEMSAATAGEVEEFLRRRGYAPHRWDGAGFVPCDLRAGEVDVFFLCESHIGLGSRLQKQGENPA